MFQNRPIQSDKFNQVLFAWFISGYCPDMAKISDFLKENLAKFKNILAHLSKQTNGRKSDSIEGVVHIPTLVTK